jgi:hypothetical protein
VAGTPIREHPHGEAADAHRQAALLLDGEHLSQGVARLGIQETYVPPADLIESSTVGSSISLAVVNDSSGVVPSPS